MNFANPIRNYRLTLYLDISSSIERNEVTVFDLWTALSVLIGSSVCMCRHEPQTKIGGSRIEQRKPELNQVLKAMLCIWWDCKALIQLLPVNQTIGRHLYLTLLHQIKQGIQMKKLNRWNQVILLYRNARPYMGNIVTVIFWMGGFVTPFIFLGFWVDGFSPFQFTGHYLPYRREGSKIRNETE